MKLIHEVQYNYILNILKYNNIIPLERGVESINHSCKGMIYRSKCMYTKEFLFIINPHKRIPLHYVLGGKSLVVYFKCTISDIIKLLHASVVHQKLLNVEYQVHSVYLLIYRNAKNNPVVIILSIAVNR